jgi:hypothetical protein
MTHKINVALALTTISRGRMLKRVWWVFLGRLVAVSGEISNA